MEDANYLEKLVDKERAGQLESSLLKEDGGEKTLSLRESILFTKDIHDTLSYLFKKYGKKTDSPFFKKSENALKLFGMTSLLCYAISHVACFANGLEKGNVNAVGDSFTDMNLVFYWKVSVGTGLGTSFLSYKLAKYFAIIGTILPPIEFAAGWVIAYLYNRVYF